MGKTRKINMRSTLANGCEVCHSAVNVSCNHFGAKTCKACAAFFRRTISMKLEYTCIEEPDFCRVHCESKLICRYCRLQKCHEVGMKALMVKSNNERKRYIRISKGLVAKKTLLGSSPDDDVAVVESDEEARAEENEATPGPSSESAVATEVLETMNKFIKLESDLCDRRRLLYAETPISVVLEGAREWPYDSQTLKMFDYKASKGMSKHDFMMIMDYARGMPGFDELNYADSVFCYRVGCAVDFVVNSAFYTYKRGIQYDELVLNDGSYLPMNPIPLTGYEANASLLFRNEEDLSKFRTLMPLLMEQWQVTRAFATLEPTFEEFCLLKAVCIWHSSYYRLSETGRRVAMEQRDKLIRALHHACHLRNESLIAKCDEESPEDVGQRFGNAVLGLSSIMEQFRNVCCSFVMISFFGILNVDSCMIDVTSFW